jgi:hypothetical protein
METTLTSILIFSIITINLALSLALLLFCLFFGYRFLQIVQEGKGLLAAILNDTPRIDAGTWQTGVDSPDDEELWRREVEDIEEEYNPNTFPTGVS